MLDDAPNDLVELVGYLQEVTNDRLALDLVVVTAYEVAHQRILVPQLVEPDRTQVTADAPSAATPTAATSIVNGAEPFAASIDTAPLEHQPMLRHLLNWAITLGRDGLADLYTSIGKGRWVLSPRLPGQSRALVVIWNDGGAYLSPYRTVFAQEAPATLAKLDETAPTEVGQGNYIRADYDERLLATLREAYVEAEARRRGP